MPSPRWEWEVALMSPDVPQKPVDSCTGAVRSCVFSHGGIGAILQA